MHHIVCQLFWLHVEADCTLKLRWVPSKDNAVANALTRPETSQHFRLGGRGYGSYGHDCVLTAAPYFRRGARRAPTILFKTPHRRKLWHRCFSAGRWAYAVLYGPMFRLLPPPPPQMAGVVTARLCECRARFVVVIPAVCLSRFPLVTSLAQRKLMFSSECITSKGKRCSFFIVGE